MAKKSILLFNNIKPEKFLDQTRFDWGADEKKLTDPDAILVRSEKMHDKEIAISVLAVGRAGSGVDNIPIEKYASQGIVVFNTPGANANSVKELVVAGVLIAARKIVPALKFIGGLPTDKDKAEIKKLIEKEKKQFAGAEIFGKSIFVFGLGNIGARVASALAELGMNVYGYDPYKASYIPRVKVIKQFGVALAKMAQCDFITIHVDANDKTKGMFNEALIAKLQNKPTLLNFARGEIVKEKAICDALLSGKLANYVTDFYSPELAKLSNAIILPHLGASTAEAELICAQMVCDQVADFLENGNILNSVNFPDAEMANASPYRLTVINKNVPDVLKGINGAIGGLGVNIEQQFNTSRGEYAYNIIDINTAATDELLEKLKAVGGVIRVRALAVKE